MVLYCININYYIVLSCLVYILYCIALFLTEIFVLFCIVLQYFVFYCIVLNCIVLLRIVMYIAYSCIVLVLSSTARWHLYEVYIDNCYTTSLERPRNYLVNHISTIYYINVIWFSFYVKLKSFFLSSLNPAKIKSKYTCFNGKKYILIFIWNTKTLNIWPNRA